MISKKTKYALQAMEYLALNSNGRPILIAELASEGHIPKKFLEFILLALRKGGLLNSRIGKGGGYRLAHDPADISIGSVVKILEGGLSMVHCLESNGTFQCENGHDPDCCGIHLVMADMEKSINEILNKTTLADIIHKKNAAIDARSQILDYCI